MKSAALTGLCLAVGLALTGAPKADCAIAQATAVPDQAAPGAPAQSPMPAPAPVSGDQCGAAEMAALIGKPRTEIPVPVDPNRRRVYCTTCLVTQDYDPTRLNIVFDANTGLVTAVKCG